MASPSQLGATTVISFFPAMGQDGLPLRAGSEIANPN